MWLYRWPLLSRCWACNTYFYLDLAVQTGPGETHLVTGVLPRVAARRHYDGLLGGAAGQQLVPALLPQWPLLLQNTLFSLSLLASGGLTWSPQKEL